LRILVVEDEARHSPGSWPLLCGPGRLCRTAAADGERAQSLDNAEEYDAVVLDLGLPKMDG